MTEFSMKKYLEQFEENKETALTQLAQTQQAVAQQQAEEETLPQRTEVPTKEPLKSPLMETLKEEFRKHKTLQKEGVFDKEFQKFLKDAETETDKDRLAQKFLPIQEGIKKNIYFDSAGKATIGKGHLLRPEELVNVYVIDEGRKLPLGKKQFIRKGKIDQHLLNRVVKDGAEIVLNLEGVGKKFVSKDRPLTDADVVQLGAKDYKKHKAIADKAIKKYGLKPSNKQYAALVALAYNIPAAYRGESIKKALANKDFDALAEAVTKYTAELDPESTKIMGERQYKRSPGLLKNRLRLAALLRKE